MEKIMILISHRGNLIGPNQAIENNPDQINLVLNKNYHVEIDVWVIDHQIFLGHDSPTYQVDLSFLKRDRIWCHAKNLQAFEFLLSNDIHCFYHENDPFTLTSKGFIWTYPNQPVTEKSVIVILNDEFKKLTCFGVCGDFVETWKSTYSNLF
jgi:hypothetical protein